MAYSHPNEHKDTHNEKKQRISIYKGLYFLKGKTRHVIKLRQSICEFFITEYSIEFHAHTDLFQFASIFG